jgi:hypothetical protein
MKNSGSATPGGSEVQMIRISFDARDIVDAARSASPAV